MKKLLLSTAAMTLLAATLSGCESVQTKDNHSYVDGKCITCFSNPFTGKPINHEAKDSQLTSTSSVNGVKGATFSNTITHVENVEVSVDMAYIKAKRFLKFYDAEDQIPANMTHIPRAKIDSIHSTYYSVNDTYGGPMNGLNWASEYDLQLQKVSSNVTKVRLKYRLYSNGMNPKEFQTKLINAMKE